MHLCVNTQKHPQNDIFACVWLIYRMMKSPTTTQRTMWVGFFLLPFCSPPIYAAANTKVKLGHGPVIWYRWPSVPCPPVHPLSLPPLFHFSSSIQHIHALFIPLSVYIIASAFTAVPPSSASSPGFSFRVASSPSSLFPPSLRWRGFSHVLL